MPGALLAFERKRETARSVSDAVMGAAMYINLVKSVDVNSVDWQKAAPLMKAALLDESNGYLDIGSGDGFGVAVNNWPGASA
jgi:hypothetical protein